MIRTVTGPPGGAFPGAVRELTGHDEHAVSGTDTANAVRLIASVAGGVDAPRLISSDRDRLLAAIYQRNFGEHIRSTTACRACSNLFDLDFSLVDLLRAMQAEDAPRVEPEEEGMWRLPSGIRFRVPDAEDELAVAGMSAEEAERELAARSIVDDAGCADAAEQVASALDSVAPLLSLDMQASCPECGSSQSLRFDIQEYLLRRLMGERAQLLADIHRLATAYGWTLGSILSLSRRDRRTLVSLIETEASLRNRGAL